MGRCETDQHTHTTMMGGKNNIINNEDCANGHDWLLENLDCRNLLPLWSSIDDLPLGADLASVIFAAADEDVLDDDDDASKKRISGKASNEHNNDDAKLYSSYHCHDHSIVEIFPRYCSPSFISPNTNTATMAVPTTMTMITTSLLSSSSSSCATTTAAEWQKENDTRQILKELMEVEERSIQEIKKQKRLEAERQQELFLQLNNATEKGAVSNDLLLQPLLDCDFSDFATTGGQTRIHHEYGSSHCNDHTYFGSFPWPLTTRSVGTNEGQNLEILLDLEKRGGGREEIMRNPTAMAMFSTTRTTSQQQKQDKETIASPKPTRRNERKPWEDPWEVMYQQLYEFHEKFGHTIVPHTYQQGKDTNIISLAGWVKRQRNQKKCKDLGLHSTLNKAREDALNKINFVWDVHLDTWERRWMELLNFKNVHGHCNVPTKYPENQQLSVWVKRQRRMYKNWLRNEEKRKKNDTTTTSCRNSMNESPSSKKTKVRVDRLESIGFYWNPPRGNKIYNVKK